MKTQEIPRLIFGPQFSFYRKPIWNTAPYKSVSLYDVYSYITGAYAAPQTEHLRTLTEKKEAEAFKTKAFDYVTFGGTFTKRDDECLIFPSDLLCLDFDHVPNVQMYRNQFLADPEFETALMFTSPSGHGIKWIVPIRTDCHTYQEVFAAVTNYVRATYGLTPDQKCKDISRAYFLPHDAGAWINPKYVPFNAQR